MPQWIIYTDLDGTLLDFDTYSYHEVEDTVKKLSQQEIPIIFCSSKTRGEQEVYRKALHLHHPFITENGSAVYIPSSYFSVDFTEGPETFTVQQKGGYTVLELGTEVKQIRKHIEEGRKKTGCHIKGYADLSADEIIRLTHLPPEAAALAATREYSETLLSGDFQSSHFMAFREYLAENGLSCVSGGKFHTVMGNRSDKGQAIHILNRLFRQKYGTIQTAGLGDSANDIPLLEAVDFPFLVKKPNNSWQPIPSSNIKMINGIGPAGWNLAIQSILLKA